MKCPEFKAVLAEYLDGTLPAEKFSQAETHVATCSECQETVCQERALAGSLSTLMRHAAEPRILRPEARLRIKAALEREMAPTGVARFLSGLWSELVRPRFATVGLGIFAVLLALVLLERAVPRQGRDRPAVAEARSQVFITTSSYTPQYTFRQEGNLVFDTLGTRTNAVNVRLWTGETKPSFPQNQKKSIRL